MNLRICTPQTQPSGGRSSWKPWPSWT